MTSQDEYIARKLGRMKMATQAGSFAAFLDAVYFCDERNLPWPEWLKKTALAHSVRDLMGKPSRKRGRVPTPFKRAQRDLIDYGRYDMVRECRGDYKNSDGGGGPEMIPTWSETYRLASRMLRGTPYQGQSSEIRSSYVRVASRVKQGGTELLRYYLPSYRVTRDILGS